MPLARTAAVVALSLLVTSCGGSDDATADTSNGGAGGDAGSAGAAGDDGGGGAAGSDGGTQDGAAGADAAGGGGAGGGGSDAGDEGAAGSNAGGLDPGVISKSSATFVDTEMHVAAAANGFVAVAWIGIQGNGGSTTGYVFSQDDGVTWGAVQQLASPNNEVSSDPVLATDSQSNVYLTWIGFQRDTQGNVSDMHVYASIAPAGTTTFGAPVEVSQGVAEFDKPWITVMPDDTVVVTYAKTSTGGILAARSTDQAKTWTNVTIVEDGGFRNLVFPCHDASGDRLYVAYHAGGGIGLRWSDDGGATWPDPNKTAVAAQGEGQPAFDDPTCAAAGSEVWVVYGLSSDKFGTQSSPKLNRLRLAHSSDGGATIDARYDALDSAAGAYAMHPYLVREDGGALDLTYYAGASDGDTKGSFRVARSTDGGKSFAPSLVVHQPITFLSSRADPKWLGDYSGLWWTRGHLYMAYANNQPSYAHTAFYRMDTP